MKQLIFIICFILSFAAGYRLASLGNFYKVDLFTKISEKPLKNNKIKIRSKDDIFQVCTIIAVEKGQSPSCTSECSVNGEIPSWP